MSFEALAFFTGLLGSVHCISMCGPLMLAMPFSQQSIWESVLHRLLYQLGRILMYGFLGLIMGLIGQGFNFLGLQQALSLITGFLLVLAGLNYFIKGKRAGKGINKSRAVSFLIKVLGKYLSKPYGGFVAGTLNGLLPCGVVYIALAQSVNLSTPFQSMQAMLLFGLGTLPLLLITALSPLFLRKFKTPGMLVPILFIVAGSFLVARGLNLSIPFVSHTVSATGAEQCQ
jgi:hypothetical protein